MTTKTKRLVAFAAGLLLAVSSLHAAQAADEVQWSSAEKPLYDRVAHLRNVPDDARGAATAALAKDIRTLPPSANKLRLAVDLGSLCTEGDYGHESLQEVATTLAAVVRERAVPWTEPQDSDADKFSAALLPANAYRKLALLEKYEHVHVRLKGDPHFRHALQELDADDAKREALNFTLNDLSGKSWSLSQLHGQVVLVNFWATWCPPCRKEIPDLSGLYQRFGTQGFVVLGISDEDISKVQPVVSRQSIPYPILLDPQGAVKKAFMVSGIPKSFLYDRSGHLVAQAIDARSQRQFLDMLQTAGLR